MISQDVLKNREMIKQKILEHKKQIEEHKRKIKELELDLEKINEQLSH